jgi:hypothetical protein
MRVVVIVEEMDGVGRRKAGAIVTRRSMVNRTRSVDIWS